jgi:hypothetical protein
MKLNQCFGIKLIIDGFEIVEEMGELLLTK